MSHPHHRTAPSRRLGPARARLFATALFATVLALTPAGTASAQLASASAPAEEQAVTWSVRPADANAADGRSWVELTLDPGDDAREYMAVRNLGSVSAEFSLSAADGYFTDAGRFNMLPASTESVGAGTWIEIPASVTVGPGETVVVPFTVTVPENAVPGDHAAGVAASVLSAGADASGSSVSVESRVGFRVMTRVTGTLQPEVVAKSVDAQYRMSWNPFEPGRLTVDVDALNAGNVMFRLRHEAEAPGRVVPPEDAQADGVDMLPGDERTVSVEAREVWPLLFTRGVIVLTPEIADPGDVPVAQIEPVRVEFFAWTIPLPQLAVVAALALIVVALFGGRRRQKARIETLVAAAAEKARHEALSERRTIAEGADES